MIQIKADSANLPNLALVDPGKVLQPVSRLGERVAALTHNSPDLAAPFSRTSEGRSVGSFDLVLVTRAALDAAPEAQGDGVPDVTGLRPAFVMVTLADSTPVQSVLPRALSDFMTEDTTNPDGWRLWRLKRAAGQPPELLRWLAQSIASSSPASSQPMLGLDLVWLAADAHQSPLTKPNYDRAPRLESNGPIPLRDVAFEPQVSRLSSVVRLPSWPGRACSR